MYQCLNYRLFQLTLVVFDTIYPDNVGSGTVTINVQRNPNPPQFQGDNYQRTIDEKIELGASVLQLAARDQDGVSEIITLLFTKKITEFELAFLCILQFTYLHPHRILKHFVS